MCGRVERVADAKLARSDKKSLEEAFENGALDQKSRATQANLPLVPKARADRCLHAAVNVTVGKDNVCILAA